jgi:hypothetical protein
MAEKEFREQINDLFSDELNNILFEAQNKPKVVEDILAALGGLLLGGVFSYLLKVLSES